MQRTQRNERPSRIEMTVNGHITEVWLHRNIEQVEIDGEDGLPQQMWEADEVHGALDASVTGAYVSANFDTLWDEWDDTPVLQRVREIAASSTAPVAPAESAVATDNHAAGTYLVHDGRLCKVTVPIARGETVIIGTNVTETTVAAEILAMQE